ncbi:MAG TPA: NAD(P)-dependent oxidoreductase [Kribbella sp.]|nr:NAD(P)-dependent oxidoreductase [Kribbella sp.]
MDVLVTGSQGFLGRHFVTALQERGDEVVRLDVAAPTAYDALDFFHGTSSEAHEHYDLVIHCAAVAPHRAAIDGKALAVGAGNLELDAAMFQWAARTRPGRVVYFSSSAAYPVHMQDGCPQFLLTEDDVRLDRPNEVDAIYGWVKVTGERLAAAYREQGGAVTVLRPFSGYGEDQSSNFPFGAFRDRAVAREDPFVIWGDGRQVRDWIHVDDVVGATLAAVEQGVDGPLNLCTGRGMSMIELAELFADAAGYRPTYKLASDAPAGVAYRVGDPTRLQGVYKPQVSIEDGVRRALAEVMVDGSH